MTTGENLRVLVVEDDRDMAFTIRKLLAKQFSAQTDLALDIASARRFLSEKDYDIVTLDYQLPDGDGLSLLNEIVRAAGHARTIIITGHGDARIAAKAFKAGAAGYVVKGARMAAMLKDAIKKDLASIDQDEAQTSLAENREELELIAERDRDLFGLLMETSPVGICVIDNKGSLTYANRRAEEILGLKKDEITQRHYQDPLFEQTTVDGAPLPEEELPFSLIKATGEPVYDVRHGIQHPGRNRKIISVNAAPVIDAEGKFQGAIATFDDITVHVRDVQDLKKAQEELRRVNEELDGYAHTVSHDLRTPLAAITLTNSMTREALADIQGEGARKEVAENVDTIDRNLNRAYMLINGLLSLAEAGRRPTEVEQVDVAGIISDILAERGHDIHEKRVRVEVDDEMGTITAHPLQMYQVFANLVGNAITHNDSPEPVIALRYFGKDLEGAHQYCVCDNGSGIPEKHLEKVFMPFFKGGSKADTGIGLSIVKKTVIVYGGGIRAYNHGGACFEFTIRDFVTP